MAVALAACGPAPRNRPPASVGPSGAERGYRPPPELASAVRTKDGRLLLTGTAPPGSRVRLATPSGEASFTNAGVDGAWRMAIPQASVVRLFGLSAATAGRTVQAEGYLAVAPNGEAAQLRSGSGARALGTSAAGVALLAADFDRKGGTVISGRATNGALVTVVIDGKPLSPVKAKSDGRFLLPLNEPLKDGSHSVLAQADGLRAQESLVVSAAARPEGGPFEARTVDGGWRIDWLTPGGGVQSTILYGRGA